MTPDRIIHGVVSLAVVGTYVFVRRNAIPRPQYIPIVVVALLGTWVSDWDLVLGIGYHRSPITHSAIPGLVLGWLLIKWQLRSAGVGFALGLASHLLWDIVDYGDVRWISGGNNDRLFLFVNAVVLITYAVVVGRKIGFR